jgi:hypothetical protein
MKRLVLIALGLYWSGIVQGQCDFSAKYIVNVDSIGCCGELNGLSMPQPLHDTIRFKLYLAKLICNPEIPLHNFNTIVDSIIILEEDFRNGNPSLSNSDFLQRNITNVELSQRRIFLIGYNKSIFQNDFFSASRYAEKLKRNCSIFDYSGRNRWRDLVLLNFQKYAGEDFLKLLKYHEFWLLCDEATFFRRNPFFDGYDYFVGILSKFYSKSQFLESLEDAICTSVIKKTGQGIPRYSMHMNFDGAEIDYFENDISIKYLSDTVVLDTVAVFDCWGNDPRGSEYVEIQKKVIKNQISDLQEMTEYKIKFRRTLLFSIAQDLKD